MFHINKEIVIYYIKSIPTGNNYLEIQMVF